jgi:hypothetical protein
MKFFVLSQGERGFWGEPGRLGEPIGFGSRIREKTNERLGLRGLRQFGEFEDFALTFIANLT